LGLNSAAQSTFAHQNSRLRQGWADARSPTGQSAAQKNRAIVCILLGLNSAAKPTFAYQNSQRRQG